MYRLTPARPPLARPYALVRWSFASSIEPSRSGVLAPNDADVLGTSSRAAPTFFASMSWRWSAGRDLRSIWRALFMVMAPAKDAPLNPPLEAVLALQPITAACRVSGAPLRQLAAADLVDRCEEDAARRCSSSASSSCCRKPRRGLLRASRVGCARSPPRCCRGRGRPSWRW